MDRETTDRLASSRHKGARLRPLPFGYLSQLSLQQANAGVLRNRPPQIPVA
jgi:hypothetical protein